MKQTAKKELIKFLWKLLTAFLAAAGGAASANAACASGWL